MNSIDDYAEDGRPEEVCVVFTMINVNKFAISSFTVLILGILALRSYLRLICEYELHNW